MLADICEAVVGAVYVDCEYDLSVVHEVLYAHMLPFVLTTSKAPRDALSLWPAPLTYKEAKHNDDSVNKETKAVVGFSTDAAAAAAAPVMQSSTKSTTSGLSAQAVPHSSFEALLHFAKCTSKS